MVSKHAPGYTPEVHREKFDLNLKFLITTLEAVKDAPKHFKPDNKYSEFVVADAEYVMEKLRATFPGQPEDFLKEHVSTVIDGFNWR